MKEAEDIIKVWRIYVTHPIFDLSQIWLKKSDFIQRQDIFDSLSQTWPFESSQNLTQNQEYLTRRVKLRFDTESFIWLKSQIEIHWFDSVSQIYSYNWLDSKYSNWA